MRSRYRVVLTLALSVGIGGLLAGAAGSALAEGDPANGEKIFRKCQQCHSVTRGETKIGPSLAGIYGRQPGSVPDFGYSQDMVDFGAAGNYWNAETLNAFLTRPRGLIAKTKMAFPGLRRESDREDLIAYISQF